MVSAKKIIKKNLKTNEKQEEVKSSDSIDVSITTNNVIEKKSGGSKKKDKVVEKEEIVEKTENKEIEKQEENITKEDENVKDDEKKSKNTENLDSVFLNKLQSFVEKINNINKEVKEIQIFGKTLEKDFMNVIKLYSKQKKNKNSENRILSGFAMPSLLSDELYTFLNIEKGTKIPRKDVTRMINEYIKNNNST